jgi:hypothetical protein
MAPAVASTTESREGSSKLPFDNNSALNFSVVKRISNSGDQKSSQAAIT